MPQYLIVYDIKELDCGTRQRGEPTPPKAASGETSTISLRIRQLAELKSLADSIGMTGGKALVLKKRVVHLS